MSRTALILAAHGSRRVPAVNEVIRQMADTLTQRLDYDEIVAAFHQGEPTFAAVLDRLEADRVIVVPVMTSAGYYCDEFLPGELQKNRRYSGVRIAYTPPVGVHPDMAKLVSLRAQELVNTYGLSAAQTTLAIVGHGTPRHPQSRAATEELVRTLQRDGDFAEVLAAFLDESPLVENLLESVRCPAVIVIPFLIGAGPHAIADIPRRLGITSPSGFEPPFVDRINDRRIICDRPIGADARIIDIIIKLASKRTGPLPSRRRLLRLGTRASAMALWQARHVQSQLRTAGADVEIVELSTIGDRLIDRAINDLPGDAPFTQDIEDALLDGRIDLAVHCLKDLPVRSTPGLRLAAILKRDSVAEALVSRGDVTLRELPPGAVIGTSSPRRTAQLLAIRPDLRTATIRGPVEERVRQVRASRFDATILAAAGLQRLGLTNEIAEELSLDDFLPAPGQGALAVQVRDDDADTAALCSVLDDVSTRRATTAELEFLRPYENSRDLVAAAYAVVEQQILLYARLLSADGRLIQDITVVGDDPIVVARKAHERLQTRAATSINDLRRPECAVGAAI